MNPPPVRRRAIVTSPVIMGIDASLTATAVHIRQAGKDVFSGIIQTGKGKNQLRGMPRLESICVQMEALLATWKPDIVFLEGYAFGAKGDAVTKLAELGGMLRMMLWKYSGIKGSTVKTVNPLTLKMFVTGKGNSKKEVMLMEILRRWEVAFIDNNAADAYAIARFAEAWKAKGEGCTATQKAALSKGIEPIE